MPTPFISETVIVEIQSQAYTNKSLYLAKVKKVAEAKQALLEAENQRDYVLHTLQDFLTFLDAHNGEANRAGESWFEVMGIEKPAAPVAD